MSNPSASQTGIAVSAKILFLNFLMLLFKPIVQIDGQQLQGAWSTTFFPAAPGQHSVTVFWKLYGLLPIQRATALVTVTEGATTEIRYGPRWIVFLPGKISVAQPVPVAA